MSKIVDITDKLSFAENPKLCIKGKQYEVNADAPTVLKIMALMDEDATTKDMVEGYNLLLSEKDRAEIDGMKLPFADLLVIIQSAMELATGSTEGDDQGEQ